MSATERRKGAEAEREVCKILRSFGFDVQRTSNGLAQNGACDISGVPGYAIEVKRQERLSVPAALDQLGRDCPPGKIPLLIHRPSRHGWMATIALGDLLELIAAYVGPTSS